MLTSPVQQSKSEEDSVKVFFDQVYKGKLNAMQTSL